MTSTGLMPSCLQRAEDEPHNRRSYEATFWTEAYCLQHGITVNNNDDLFDGDATFGVDVESLERIRLSREAREAAAAAESARCDRAAAAEEREWMYEPPVSV